MTAQSSNESGQGAPLSGRGSVPEAGGTAHVGGAGDSDANAQPGTTAGASADSEPRRKSSVWFRPNVTNTKLIYAGYLVSLALPVIAIVAAVFAHQSAKEDPPAWLATHYLYQIRTFWIGLFANLVAWALTFAGVGLLLFPLIAVWVVARSVKGLIRLGQSAPIEEPLSYFV